MQHTKYSSTAEAISAIDETFVTVNLLNSKKALLLETIKKYNTSIETISSSKATADQVSSFFLALDDTLRQELENKVQGLVDYGLKTVFGPNYGFKVTSAFKGSSVRTEFYLIDHEMELPFLEAAGGGISDVASFLLRVVMLSITKPHQRPVIILDEPFKFVSKEYFDNLGQLLQELTSTLGIQLIMVTHKPELIPYATTLIEVSQTKTKSKAIVTSRVG